MGANGNGITISGRLVERVLLGALVLFSGGNAIVANTEREQARENVGDVCVELQGLRNELADLFEPFLELPSDDPAGRRALERTISSLRQPHACP